MNHMIIGTAGHVDHGKTALIKALTGIDADRLAEEKKRGITIDLGFAYMDLGENRKVGIVDVPGHEKFIHNMLAGAGGVNLALLVVAADDGVMPQTREHLDILSLLDISRGVIAVTKTDLVEPELLGLVEEEIRETVKGTFLENAPIVRTSAYTGEGIDALKRTLTSELDKTAGKGRTLPCRMPVDRVFTITGFGTIVTGTLTEGTVDLKHEYCLYPKGAPVKIRGIQIHSEKAAEAFSGQRVAVNISNMRKEDIRRGDILAVAGSLLPTRLVDVRLQVLKSSKYPVTNNSRVHFYQGAFETVAKVRLLDRPILMPGESCYAQLRLDDETSVKKWDRCVIRFYSPLTTIGGGVILDACPLKKRRNHPPVLEGLRVKETGGRAALLEQAVREYSALFYTLGELVLRAGLDGQSAKTALDRLIGQNKAVLLNGGACLHADFIRVLQSRLTGILRSFHRENPLEPGMSRQELRARLAGEDNVKRSEGLLEYFEEKKVLRIENATVALATFQRRQDENDEKLKKQLETLYLDAGFAVPANEAVSAQFEENPRFKAIMGSLLRVGLIVRLDARYNMHRDYLAQAEQRFRKLAAAASPVELAAFRDALGSSRKVALAVMEYLDMRGITKKDGEGRILLR
ncbi:selenocysteine-specific elongation factor [Sporobacter termitidis DSM 10068]|uniref:Selenocysteine-specific elongation factor n=1 Tax=Sporobacter termitidis DSM 10068 TaxID=1123282 RepID=A0A1M5TYN9_9FIRM|nr:selenocysteine-specific translation elongation factor [Sporobacter termitidis]SHH55945.1 selenocysteine-specific elongation factor [Sporobacter termitidis DSM 10068]